MQATFGAAGVVLYELLAGRRAFTGGTLDDPSVTLTRGAVRMARHHVIVKNLAAIQSFGSMDVLKKVVGDFRNRNVVNIEFITLDEEKQQIEGTFELRQLDFIMIGC